MLHLHRAERADGLVEALGALLAEPPADPFAPEVVSVPTRGMERWLTQQLSGRLGICANVEFPFPGRLAGDAAAAAAGIDPARDPWRPERSVWPLLAVVDESLPEPWLARLAAHLREPARRFATVRHLAGLFDRYALQRPRMVQGWAAGEDGGWQAELWRRLRERIGEPGPAERLGPAAARLAAEPGLVALPPRLSAFGLTRLPPAHLEILRALAAHRDVHLFLLHPSPALWERITEPRIVPRARDATATLPRNRLLATWGQDARELQLVLGGGHADHHHPVEHREDTLLARIQADVRGDRPPAGDLPAADDSLQVHACHGHARQVEVARDAILHLLAADPSLEPRDVIVMCPDIETFAPLIQAAFGATEEGALPDLRVRLADRSIRRTNPLLGALAQLVDLADQRLTASQVLGLADREPVRRRFGLDDEDVARIERWVAAGGIRWGLDAAHRAPFKLDALAAGTWRAGLDRLLLGVTMTEEGSRLFGGVLPLDDVASDEIGLAGRFAELVDRLEAAVASLAAPKPIAAWAAALAEAADALAEADPREPWQRTELQRLLDDVVAEAAGASTALSLPEVRGLLAERLQARPTRANFRTGHLTVCTLVPMRSVPHRVVVLLGLDDAVFPRKAPRDGDDLLLDEPHVGDREPRLEDRQLLLDALLAATDRLIVTYTGNDERTNVPCPPAVPVGELLDVVDRTAPGARERVVVRHPLQPFDPRNFAPGALVPGTPWSFDSVTLDGARAMAGERARPGPFLARPLPAEPAALVELDALAEFTSRPVRAFLRRRLGVSVSARHDEVDDALPVELDPLERWDAGQRLLEARLAGTSLDAAVAAEVARGTLPPGGLADPVVAELRPLVEAIAARAEATLGPRAAARSIDVDVRLPDGRRVTGTVPDVHGNVAGQVMFARVGPRQRLAAWVRWLALRASEPGRPFAAATIGRDAGTGVAVARIPAGAGGALEHLAALVDLYDRGMREPLPLACRTSAAYAEAAHQGANAEAAGRRAWLSTWAFDKEDAEPDHELVFGGRVPFEALLEAPPREDERWHPAEATRFGQYARRLWAGLLAEEER